MSKKSPTDIIAELTEIVAQLDWVIALPDNEEQVSGLIIGTREYCEEVAEMYYGPGFSIFEYDGMDQVIETPPTKKSVIH